MTISEVLLEDFDIEMSNTRRTLERVPEDRPDYRPHEKSMPLGRLTMHCAMLPRFGAYILEANSLDMAAPNRNQPDLTFHSRANCIEQFDPLVTKCRNLLAAATDEQLLTPWRFSFGEHLISNASRSRTFRSLFFNHLVHHVAQLGVYLRLNDVPVPSLYGPSADEQMPAKS